MPQDVAAKPRSAATNRVKDAGNGFKVWIPEQDIRAAKALANLEGRPTSHLVRDAIRQYVARARKKGGAA